MKLARQISIACLVLLVFSVSAGTAFAAESGVLCVGVAKVDMTPDDPSSLTNLFQTQYTGVHDKIYARAIVLSNGPAMAAIIAVDTVEFADGTPLVERISRETGIPTSNIILAATHNHNAPMLSLQNASGSRKSGPGAAAFIAKVEDDLVASIKKAKAGMQPARVGVGKGAAYINVNRDKQTSGGMTRGQNPDGPSDKTVWVIRFETTTGEPLALFINYAVHAAIVSTRNSLLTAELPGVTSRFVEQHYNDKVVALWTCGAAGDQNAIVTPDSSDVEMGFEMADVLGRILGEEVVRVADGIKAATTQARIWGTEKVVSCPGQKPVQPGPRSSASGDMDLPDADPVSVRLGLLMIDKIALTSVSAEITTSIYQRLRKESPFANTIMVTLANGRVDYIADDVSHDKRTIEAIESSVKKGAESIIVNGLLEMMQQY